MERISNKAESLINAKQELKLAYVYEDKWIQYDMASLALARLETMLNMPRKLRPVSMLLVGRTNNGKSSILKRFCDQNPPYRLDGESFANYPVLKITLPATANIGALYGKILQKTYTPYRYSDSPEKKESKVFSSLKRLQVKILVVDEFQNILSATDKKRFTTFQMLRDISSELNISIVAAGTKMALSAIKGDDTLESRLIPFLLPKWELNEEFQSLLASVEYFMPFIESSNISDPLFAEAIYYKCDGSIGDAIQIVQEIAAFAIQHDRSKMLLSDIDKINWKKSSNKVIV